MGVVNIFPNCIDLPEYKNIAISNASYQTPGILN